MSLETDVANLVTKTTQLIDYFNGKKAGIDSALAAAIAAAPATTRNWYVDQINGLDTNPGTQALPFKTLGRAVAVTPDSGYCTANIIGDYDLAVPVGSNCAVLYIAGVPTNGVRPKLKPKYMSTIDASQNASTNMAGFTLYLHSHTIAFRDLDIVLPTPAGITPAPTNARAGSFIRSFAGVQLPAAFHVGLENVNVTMASDWFGFFIGLTSSNLILNVNASTFPSGFGGRYVSNVASGALPKDLGHVMTNLTSL